MGLQDEVKEVKDLMKELIDEKKVKEKKFRYPFGKKVGKSQKKKNYITVLVLNENGVCDFKKYQIMDQTFIHDLIPRLASTGHVMRDKKGNPVVILPNWSVEPFSPLNHYQQTLIDGSNKNGYRLLMNRMESEKLDSKKSIGKIVPWIIGIGLAGIILYAILSGGGT